MSYRLIPGDSTQALRKLAIRVDAIVTDPPAGIAFMGKGWDCFRRTENPADVGRDDVFGRTSRTSPHSYGESDRGRFIATIGSVMLDAKRLLRPGGYAVVWALPRTSHWTATALEDAGYEIRDVVCHVFGCVPTDAEMLTPDGWRTKDQLVVGQSVAQVDARGALSIGPLAAVSTYPFDGEMEQIQTRSVRQLLTPGHSVHAYAKRNKWRRVEVDADLTRLDAQEFCGGDRPGVAAWLLPLAARGVDVAALHSVGSVDVAALCGWTIAEGHFHSDVEAVSIYQNEGDHADEIRALLARLAVPHSEYRRTRTDYDGQPRECVQWYLHVGAWSTRLRELLAGKKPTPPQWMAWLQDDEARALFEALVSGDGTRNPSDRSGAWYQKRPDVRAWFQALCFRLGYRSIEDVAKSAVSWCRADTTEVNRGTRRRACSKVKYEGEVWCPTVSTGRWVCRWRGSVFVTGNTGFPKSSAVLKPASEHWIVCRRPGPLVDLRIDDCRVTVRAPEQRPRLRRRRWNSLASSRAGSEDSFAPTVGRWPANFVMSHSPGCRRVGDRVVGNGEARPASGTGGMWSGVSNAPCAATYGTEVVAAWECDDGCPVRLMDDQAGHRRGGIPTLGASPSTTQTYGKFAQRSLVGYLDEGSASRYFNVFEADPYAFVADPFLYMAKPSRAEREAGCEGLPEVAVYKGEVPDNLTCLGCGLRQYASTIGGAACGCAEPQWRSSGDRGVRNTHPTVKSVGLMRHLVRLVTPVGGTVLDPFMGSGTTGVAALHERCRFVGVEREAEYLAIARARLRRAHRDAQSRRSAQ